MDFESVQGGGATGGLVRDHTADGTPEDLGRSTVMERTMLGVHVVGLALESLVLQLLTVEAVSHLDGFTADNGDLLTVQQLLGNDGCQSALDVATPVDDQLLLERHFDCFSSNCKLQ